jgi:hypothetical protein
MWSEEHLEDKDLKILECVEIWRPFHRLPATIEQMQARVACQMILNPAFDVSPELLLSRNYGGVIHMNERLAQLRSGGRFRLR